MYMDVTASGFGEYFGRLSREGCLITILLSKYRRINADLLDLGMSIEHHRNHEPPLKFFLIGS